MFSFFGGEFKILSDFRELSFCDPLGPYLFLVCVSLHGRLIFFIYWGEDGLEQNLGKIIFFFVLIWFSGIIFKGSIIIPLLGSMRMPFLLISLDAGTSSFKVSKKFVCQTVSRLVPKWAYISQFLFFG